MEQVKKNRQHKTNYTKLIGRRRRRRNKELKELINYNPYCALLGAIIKQWIDEGAQSSTYDSVKVYVDLLKYFFPDEFSAMTKLKRKIARVKKELRQGGM